MSIWKSYFYKVFLQTVLFILLSIYGLYILVDIMSHLKVATSTKDAWPIWIEYYLATFSKRLDILIPFSILLATIRTLLNFQGRGEFVAMLASGVSKQELLKPFFYIVLAFTSIVYLNYELVLPSATSRMVIISETRFGKDQIEKVLAAPKEVMLKDGSKIIYGSYKRKEKEFEDLFWIRSVDHIIHMKTLSIAQEIPQGKWVDIIERSKNGLLEVTKSVPEESFQEMHFDKQALKNSLIPPSEQSPSELFYQSWLYLGSSSPKACEIKAFFLYRLTFPLLCILAFIAPAPYCMRFQRHMPILMIYLVAVAGLFSASVLFQACLSLGKNQLIAPYLAIGVPWILLGTFFGRRYQSL